MQVAQAVHHDRNSKKIVHRAVEKTLDLAGMQIYGNHPVRAGYADKIRCQLGAYRRARAYLAILAGIAVIGYNGCDASRACALERVHHQAKLHEVAVYLRRASGLNHKNIVFPHIVADFYAQFAITEGGGKGGCKLATQVVADSAGKLGIGRAGYNFKVAEHMTILAPEILPENIGWDGRI